MKLISLLIFFPLFICAQNSENVWLSKPKSDGETLVINNKGDITFKLLPKENPKVTFDSGFTGDFFMQNLLEFDFAEGPMPVKSSNGTRLIDINGNTVADLGNEYKMVFPPSDGIIMAFKQSETKRGASDIYFLDTKGKVIHNGQKYWEASPYSNGLSAVQILKDGPWQVIDKKGNKQFDFKGDMAPYISKIVNLGDEQIVAKIKRPIGYEAGKNIYTTTVFDLNGKQLFDGKTITGRYNDVNIRPFKNGISYVEQGGKHTFFDKDGTIKHVIPIALNVLAQTKDYLLVNEGKPSLVLYDSNFKLVEIPAGNKGDITLIDQISEDYLSVLYIDTLAKKATHEIIEPVTFNTVFTFKEPTIIISMRKDRLVLGEPDGYKSKLSKIIDLQGNVLYEPSNIDKQFGSITEALPVKDEVYHIKLSEVKDFSGIEKLTNLKTIEISNYEGSSIPSFSKFAKLEKLTINNCDHLTSLPSGLEKSSIKELFISDCAALSGLEEKILALKSLTKVHTSNYDFRDGFIEDLKTKQPNLIIDNWQSSGWDSFEFEESFIEEAPAPPPPPPASMPKKKGNK